MKDVLLRNILFNRIGKLFVTKCLFAFLIFALCLQSNAGMRHMPGKYSGVVVFDRWDNAYFLSSFSQFYISESIKEAFRKYSGKNIQIFAEEITQHSSTRSGRINQFKYIGRTPGHMRPYVRTHLNALYLQSYLEVTESGKAQLVLSIENTKRPTVEVFSSELGFLILKQKQDGTHSNDASDGTSTVILGGHGFRDSAHQLPRTAGKGMTYETPYQWTIGAEHALPRSFYLKYGEKRLVKMNLKLTDGAYDFLFRYGGYYFNERCVPSNWTAFDVKDGHIVSQEISGGLGFQLGEKLDGAEFKLMNVDENGLKTYRVNSNLNGKFFDAINIKTSPISKRIWAIQGLSFNSDAEETVQQFSQLTGLLQDHFGNLELHASDRQFSPGMASFTVGARKIQLGCQDTLGHILQISYEDSELHIEAKKEALHLARGITKPIP